ncbi:MAG: hypothetical protein V4633_08095 [Pseudomonadota bacterium]
MNIVSGPPSPQIQAMLKALQDAVTNDLNKKQKLGQYAVIWKDGRAIQTGDDVPPGPPDNCPCQCNGISTA